ncbi:MAG: hypothetical protein PHR77_19015 [Kiritimatiellae bacterium]|nr:hypothetical protein [Kiritimatiellia bacterium]MDD5522306.1 hypothetical protein [Kiritimatiellia bacterium]
MNKIFLRIVNVILFLFLVFILAGCTSMEMKGTPFYTGEYELRKGPAEDRVNVWPLMYYRDPALSVLWPTVELTDDHFAIRPLMSVYGLGGKDKEYNVLWPLGQFDFKAGNSRIFPFFWGKDYFTAFPLYWHFDHPFASDGYDGLIPLWSYYADKHGYSLYMPWPIIRIKQTDGGSGWHLWPLAGNYSHDDGYYRFLFWPLGHQWSDHDGVESGNSLIPLYLRSKDKEGSAFFSLPWSSGNDADGSSWQLTPPLFYHSSDEKDGSMFLSPLYCQGSDVSGSDKWSLLLPLYYHSKDANGSMFVSLPWLSGEDAGGNGWHLVPPLFFREKGKFHDLLLTPLYSHGQSGEGKKRWSMMLPLYYESELDNERLFTTILGGYSSDFSGRKWMIYPLLSGGKRGEDSGDLWLAAPFVHARWNKDHVSSHIMPLYYWDGEDRTFVSPVYARWRTETGRITGLVPPALSWFTGGDRRNDLWIAGPLAHFSWGEDAGSSHVFPLFYNDGKEETIVSLPIARWKSEGRSNIVYPLLLSGYSTDGTDMDIIALLGLFHNKWNPDVTKRSGHLLPLYYYEDKTFYTPLFGWKNEKCDGFYYPLTPILGVKTGDFWGGWLFPLCSYGRERQTGEIDGTFLWGMYWRDKQESGSVFFPVYGYWNDGSLESVTHTNRTGSYGTTFVSFPACWYKNRVQVRTDKAGRERITNRMENGFFPLWNYSDVESPADGKADVNASVFLLLCDYKREVRPVKNDAQAKDEYTRARILWRLWHYERSNDDVSVDVFPAITYDRKSGKFRKVSFLWRFFRYERDEKGKKADIIFIPVIRTGVK